MKFKATVTRLTTETVVLEIEAEDMIAARYKAYETAINGQVWRDAKVTTTVDVTECVLESAAK